MQAAAQDEHGLSAYERERLETLRNNNRVLVDLGLGPAPLGEAHDALLRVEGRL